jgi:vancomycin resistance protein VanJ
VKPGQLKVLTFNVNYGGVDPSRSAEAILASGADLVALQETNPAWETVLTSRLKGRYPHQRYFHAPAAGGLAFLSRWPLGPTNLSPPPSGGWFAAWHAEVQTPLGRVHLLNVHLRPPIGESGATSSMPSAYLSTRPIRASEMAHHMAGLPARGPVLVLGDFNEGDQGRAVTLLRKRGFASALGSKDPATATWQWQTSLGPIRTRLDHILFRGLRLKGAQVLPEAASDHFPVEAVFTSL